MKRLLLSLLLPAATLAAQAEYTTMTFVTTDNTTTVVSATALNITFSGETLVAESVDRHIEIPLSQMASMHFSEGGDGELSAIDQIMADNQTADVYTIDGIHAGSFSSRAEMRNQLPAGIYIVRNQSGENCKLILSK